MARKITKDLFETDWERELQSSDVGVRRDSGKEMQVVYLAALQRLARQAGITKQSLVITTPSDTMVQAVFSCIFTLSDGSYAEFVGSADCNVKNTSGVFVNYPTAVAESRAEARCLRKALGIRMLSSEEIGMNDNAFSVFETSTNKKVDPQVIVAIEKLCETRNVSPARVIDEVIHDTKRAGSIFELSELTVDEAQRALAWLNEQRPNKKTLSAEEQRTARKEELLAKQKDSK